jgi:ketosteroid isomerase-like protein
MPFVTPQDAEDAFYDAIDEHSPDQMRKVWSTSPDSMCLLPMQPMIVGGEPIQQHWRQMMQPGFQLEISVTHLRWIESGDLAVHLVEERLSNPQQGGQQPPIYATNIYRKGDDGWLLLVHINSPAPPPPGSAPPGMVMPD